MQVANYGPGVLCQRPSGAPAHWARLILADAGKQRLFPVKVMVELDSGKRCNATIDSDHSGPILIDRFEDKIEIPLERICRIKFLQDAPIDRSDELGR